MTRAQGTAAVEPALGADRRHLVVHKLLNKRAIAGMAWGDILARDLEAIFGALALASPAHELRLLGASLRTALRSTTASSGAACDVFFVQTGTKHHHESIRSLVAQSTADLGVHMSVTSPAAPSGLRFADVFMHYRWRDLAKAIRFTAQGQPLLRQALRATDGTWREGCATTIASVRQTSEALSVRRFLAADPPRLLVSDFDRGNPTAKAVAAARALSIPTLCIQHGIIWPSSVPSGYSPVITDKVWVWGDAARQQLIREGVDAAKIVVLGNPALLRPAAAPAPADVPRRKVLLALSWPDLRLDRLLVQFFADIKQVVGGQWEYEVRLHPGRKTKDYAWIESDFDLTISDRDKDSAQAISEAAAVLITNSTIGIEAINRGVPVAVVDLPDVPLGQGEAYVNYLQVPSLRAPEDFAEFLRSPHTVPQQRVETVMRRPSRPEVVAYLRSLLAATVPRTGRAKAAARGTAQ